MIKMEAFMLPFLKTEFIVLINKGEKYERNGFFK